MLRFNLFDAAQFKEKIMKKAIQVPKVMCEAYDYKKPAAFSRGMEAMLGNDKLIFVSGTASVGPDGRTKHKGNFRAQAKLMFKNVTDVLSAANATWNDVVKATIYLRDIDRDYEEFNEVRCDFFDSIGLDPYPASVCVEARLCRNELLVEMEAIAIK